MTFFNNSGQNGFLQQSSLALYLGSTPTFLGQYLTSNPTVLENYFESNPTALLAYLNSDPDALEAYLVSDPQILTDYFNENPSVLTNYLDSYASVIDQYVSMNPEFLTNYIEANPGTLDTFLADNPDVLDQYLESSGTPLGQSVTDDTSALVQLLTDDPDLLEQFLSDNPAVLTDILANNPSLLQDQGGGENSIVNSALVDSVRLTVNLTGTGNNATGGLLSTYNLGSGGGSFTEALSPQQLSVVSQAANPGAYALNVTAQGSNNVLVGGLLGNFQSQGGGNNQFVLEDSNLLGLGGQTIPSTLLTLGSQYTSDGTGDTVYFVGGGDGGQFGNVTINGTNNATGATLDFSNVQGSGIDLDMSQVATSGQQVTPANGSNLFLAVTGQDPDYFDRRHPRFRHHPRGRHHAGDPGCPGPAADRYERAARDADGRGDPIRAAQLHLVHADTAVHQRDVP